MLVILFFPLFLLNQELFSLLALPRNVHALNRQMVGWAWRDLKGHSHASASFCSTDARLYIDIQLIFADCSQILILSVVQYLFFFSFLQFSILEFFCCWPLRHACMLRCIWVCNSMDYSLPGSSVHGILHVRTLERVAMLFYNIHNLSVYLNNYLAVKW